MDIVGFFGLAAALLCAGVIVMSLCSGRVPARWPVPALDRHSAPKAFWTMILIYAAGAMMGGLVASMFIG